MTPTITAIASYLVINFLVHFFSHDGILEAALSKLANNKCEGSAF